MASPAVARWFIPFREHAQASRGKPYLFRYVTPDLPTCGSNDYRASWFMGQLPPQASLISGSCTSQRTFVYGFLQIPSHDGHPCQ